MSNPIKAIRMSNGKDNVLEGTNPAEEPMNLGEGLQLQAPSKTGSSLYSQLSNRATQVPAMLLILRKAQTTSGLVGHKLSQMLI